MLDNRTPSAAALALALALGACPAPGAAQNSTYDPADSGSSCTPRTTATCSMAGVACGDGGECRMMNGGGFTCVPPTGFVCCTSDAQCFVGDGGQTFACVDTPELTGTDMTSSTGLCVHSATCVGDDAALSLEELERNLSTATTDASQWFGGDFDRDGLTNGQELELETDPCEKPDPRAYWNGTACAPIPVGCTSVDGACLTHNDQAGDCQLTDDGTECVPIDDALWCGGEFTCDDGEVEVADPVREQVWCVPGECAGLVGSLLACISGGENLVPYASGDCDGDGTANDVDDTPCGDLPDAGPPSPGDGGQSPTADGGGVDRFDAGGERTDPSFEGGGGCRCRAAPSSSELPRGLPLALVGLGLVALRAGRRRRA